MGQGDINKCLNGGLDGDKANFSSANELNDLLTSIDYGLGPESWEHHIFAGLDFYIRDLRDCIKLLLRNSPFAEQMAFVPVENRTEYDNLRIFDEMCSGTWWWETQQQIPPGGTLLPLIFASDKTHLTNYSGNKSCWPVYMTLGNIDKATRAETSKQAWVLVALLPIGTQTSNNSRPKNGIRPGPGAAPRPRDSQDIYHTAMEYLFHPLLYPNSPNKVPDLHQHANTEPVFLTSGWPGFKWLCADGYYRRCFPVLAAWVADSPEYNVITRSVQNSCPRCEIPIQEMGHHDGGSLNHKLRCSNEMETLFEAPYTPGQRDMMDAVDIWRKPNFFWRLPLCNVYRLWQPDLLHQIWIGVAATMMGWLKLWLEVNKLWTIFTSRWTVESALYPGLIQFSVSYDCVKQWTGKERRQMMRILMSVLIPIMVGINDCEKVAGGHDILECVRNFTEFSLYASQRSHTTDSLKRMDVALKTFYKKKIVFRDHVPSKKSFQQKLDADLARMKALEEEETGADVTEEWSESTTEELKTKHFKFSGPKIHVLSHYVETIAEMGTPDNFSTDMPERMHKQLKDGYRHSNRVDYYAQILRFLDRHVSFEYMQSNLKFLFEAGAEIPGIISGLDIKGQNFTNTRNARRKNPDQIEPSTFTPREVILRPQLIGIQPRVPLQSNTSNVAPGPKYHSQFRLALSQYLRSHMPGTLFNELFGPGRGTLRYTPFNSIEYPYRAHRCPDVIQKVTLSAMLTTAKSKKITAIWIDNRPDQLDGTFRGSTPSFPIMYFSWEPPEALLKHPRAEECTFPGAEWITDENGTCTFDIPAVGLVYNIPTEMIHKNDRGSNSVHGTIVVKAGGVTSNTVDEILSISGPVHLVPWDHQKYEAVRGNMFIVNSYVDEDSYWRVY